jgi:two-component system chemotaxis sensor kinase CheA
MAEQKDTSTKLSSLAEELASAVVMATPDDLQGLSSIHTQLQDFQLALPSDGGIESPVHHSASSAEKLVEKIVLGEVADAQAAVNQLTQAVMEMIATLNGGSPDTSGITTGPPTAAPDTQADTHAGDAEEAVIFNPADLAMLGEFITEASGHLESAESALLQLESNPDNIDAVNGMFRNFHTIKGVAGFLNLKPIGSVAHSAENLLDLARHGKVRVTGPVVDVILETIDLLKEMIGTLQATAQAGEPIVGPARLKPLVKRINECAVAAGDASKTSTPTKAAAVASSAQTTTSQPTQIAASAAAVASPAAATKIEKPVSATASGAVPATVKQDHKPEAPKAAAEATKSAAGNSSSDVVKVSTDRLDTLVNAIGELVIAQSMVRQDFAEMLAGNHRAAKNLSHMSKIARELQDISMSMRMVPIQGVFQKMSRLVRDLTHKFGKEIDLVLVGGETELDRGLVESISDPLVHMVRNSADHGIETPDVREKAGKPRVGKIELKAYQQAGHIVINISDDGKGLTKARILQKAIDAGIVKPDEQLSENEIFKLIFHAGLSTAEKVTDVSGRGVGMDVVRKNVEALRGRIDISSVEGKGSTFTIRLPLTLAVIDGLVIKVGGQRYVVPITSVEQTIKPTRDQLSTVSGGRGEMCNVRGTVLPLYRLGKLLGRPANSEDPTQSLIVIVHDNDRRCCLLVDELVGQQQVVIKSLGQMLGSIGGISGGAILGDGQVSLIIDVSGLMDAAVQ